MTEPTPSKSGDVAVFTVISKSEPWADETVSLVENLRDEVIPGALEGTKAQSFVGGQTAGYIDLAAKISNKLPLMIAVVVLLSFIVLLMAFRSVLVPIKAAAMNLISVAASYGVVTAVFQLGWGSSLIGLDHSIPIVSFVPLLMFAILFGLSMDYEVFLMTQMKEHYLEFGDERRAVVEGLANTGRVITSAAGIMVCVFASFVLSRRPGGEGVRGRPRGGDRDRLDRRPLPPRPGGDGADGQVGLVDAGVARQADAAHLDRGRGVLRRARRGCRRGGVARAGAGCVRLTGGVPAQPAERADAGAHPRGTRGGRRTVGRNPERRRGRGGGLRAGGAHRRPRRLHRPLAQLDHHLRQADGPARRQAPDHRRPASRWCPWDGWPPGWRW